MAILWMIRHGEPEIRGVFPEAHDPALTEQARVEARRSLSSIEVALAYTSPARRARETAGYVAATRLIELPALREIDYGQWSGLRWEQVEERWSELAAAKKEDWLGVTPPGGESWPDVLARAGEALRAIREASRDNVALVAHQGINAALMHLIDGSNPLEFVQAYGEVIRVEFD